jgi:hypothetical protein
LEEELYKDAACHQFHSTCTAILTGEAPEQCGVFKIEDQVNCTVKYADYLLLLAKEEMVLQDMTDKLLQIGRHYWNRKEHGKNKVMRILIYHTTINNRL